MDATATTNAADIPTILAQLWKDADPHEKQLFVDEQFRLEQQYNQTMLEWETASNSINININNSATMTRTREEPMYITTTSMGTHSSAYCNDMAANIFDDISPYSSVSMNSTGAGTGTGTGTTGPISSSIAYHGGYDPYNQGQHQYQQPHQQYQQQYPYYDHAAAYNYRNPYGETHPSSYGYQWPTSVGVTVANADTNTNMNAANHTSYYEGGYGDRRGSQQHSNEYEYNAHAHAHAPVTA